MPFIKTVVTVPSFATEIAMSIDGVAANLQYSKLVLPQVGDDAVCADSQVCRVLPYRTQEQFEAGDTIGGVGYQLINSAFRCNVNTEKIIVVHDCAMPAKSDDNGDSWQRLGSGTKSRGLYVDRPKEIRPSVNDDDRLVAVGGNFFESNKQFVSYLPGFYLSTDGGSTWSQTLNWTYIMANQTYSGFVEFGYARGPENALANDPSDADFWYYGSEFAVPPNIFGNTDRQYRRFFRSTDGGSSWHNQQLLDSQITGIDETHKFDWWHTIKVHPTTRHVFICTDGGLFKSTNAHTAANDGVTFSHIDVDSSRGKNLEVSDIIFDSGNPNIAYCSARDYKTENTSIAYDGEVFGYEYAAIYKSTDGGNTWSEFISTWRTVTTSSLVGSYIEESTFSEDVGTSNYWTAWRMELTPDDDDMYITGGPNLVGDGGYLLKDIKDAAFVSGLNVTSSRDHATNVSGNPRLRILSGPTTARKYETVALAVGGSGEMWKALTAEELSSAGIDSSQLGKYFAPSNSGWKGENIYSWLRTKHDPSIWLYGNADVNIWATFNDGNYVESRAFPKDTVSRGGTNRANSMAYTRPSSQRVVASLGGGNNSHLGYAANFNSEDFDAYLAFFPGLRPSNIPEDRQAEYDLRFPNEGPFGDRLYPSILQHPDNVDWLVASDSVSYDGGAEWDYIPGLERGNVGISDGGRCAEVFGLVWQSNGEHVVWATNSADPIARTKLLRATWSVASGWSDWEIVPNIFGLIEPNLAQSDPGQLPTAQRMDLATIDDLVVRSHPTNPDIVYAAVGEGKFTIDRDTGHLWKFDYAQKADTSSAFGSGLGGWTRIVSARNTGEAIDLLPAVQPYDDTSDANDNPDGTVYLWIADILVDSNPAFADDILYVVFGIPGAIVSVRSTDGGTTWEEITNEIPCSSTINMYLEPSTGEVVTSACDGCYVHPAPIGYIRDSSIDSLWSKSAAIP